MVLQKVEAVLLFAGPGKITPAAVDHASIRAGGIGNETLLVAHLQNTAATIEHAIFARTPPLFEQQRVVAGSTGAVVGMNPLRPPAGAPGLLDAEPGHGPDVGADPLDPHAWCRKAVKHHRRHGQQLFELGGILLQFAVGASNTQIEPTCQQPESDGHQHQRGQDQHQPARQSDLGWRRAGACQRLVVARRWIALPGQQVPVDGRQQ